MIVYQISLHGSAYDARGKTWPQVTSETGCKPLTEWLDPVHNRPLLIGEFGCSVSHLRVWEEIASSNLNGIILEEDATFHSFNPDHVDHLLESYDSVWLGYRWNDMGYWYNCHAYAITPDTAKLLIEDFKDQIIPVDEWVPLKLKDKSNYFYPEEVVKQIPRSTRPSTIEDTPMLDQIKPKLNIVTVATDVTKMWPLKTSCDSKGVRVTNLGSGSDWLSAMEGFDGLPKVEIVKEYLKGLPDDDLVLFMDGYDTVLADHPDVVVERFLGFNVDILFSAEESCWPLVEDKLFMSKWKDEGTPYKYLNSGVYMGRAKAISDFLEMESTDSLGDDQLYMQTRFLTATTSEFPYKVALDSEAYIFQSHDPQVQVVNGQLWNPRTHCCGCIYHGNGGSEAKEFFSYILSELNVWETELDVPSIIGKAFKEVAKDVLLVPLLSHVQCQNLIHMSEQMGTWGAMEGDKFPAQEIRAKDLGIWSSIEKLWKENLALVCESYWSPVEYMGLRDAFTMKYTMDSQRSLGLHTDASLITGSVKLNDNYEGATLYFPRQEFDNIDVPVGSCLLFPGQVTHGHYVDELKSGVKYSLTMWTSRYVGDEN
jgi:hypothetical protein